MYGSRNLRGILTSLIREDGPNRRLQWVRDIVFASSRADEVVDSYLGKLASLIRVIKGPGGDPCGRAAIGFGYIEAGIGSIGGFVSRWNSRTVSNFAQMYVGALSFEPSGPGSRRWVGRN
jgi:hypothetical protein